MLSLTQTTGYAILALSCLREPLGKPVLVKDVAACTGIPAPYLAKIMHSLGQRGLIVTKRGFRGGIVLAHPRRDISLVDIAEAVEGVDWIPKCLLGLADCSDLRCCPTHAFWKKERLKITKQLRGINLEQVAEFERQTAIHLQNDCCPDAAQAIPYLNRCRVSQKKSSIKINGGRRK